MTPLEMIAEWEKGCSCAGPAHDAIFHPKNPTSATECEPCTQGLIDALKAKLLEQEGRKRTINEMYGKLVGRVVPVIVEYAMVENDEWVVHRKPLAELPDGLRELYEGKING